MKKTKDKFKNFWGKGFNKIKVSIVELFKTEYPKEEKNINKFFYAIIFLWVLSLYYGDWADPTYLIMDKSNYRVVLFYLMIIIVLASIFSKDLIVNFKDFKNNFEKYIGLIIAVFLITVLASALGFIVIDSITGDIASNHANNLDADIIEMILILVLYAPIAEELLFRGCLRKLIKNNFSFILISSISFGFFHVIDYLEQDLTQSLYAIPYGIMGIGFAYIYVKTKNIYTNVTAHFIINLLATFSAIFDKPA